MGKKIISRGADVNAVDNKKKTALFYSARKGNVRFCRLLLKAGANPGIKDYKSRTALNVAKKNNQTAVKQPIHNLG